MKAIINLDWLDAEIDKLHEKGAKAGISSINDNDIRFDTLIEVRSKCEPIEEPKREGFPPPTGILTELSPKCLLDWESAKYCHNDNACKMCETKLNNK